MKTEFSGQSHRVCIQSVKCTSYIELFPANVSTAMELYNPLFFCAGWTRLTRNSKDLQNNGRANANEVACCPDWMEGQPTPSTLPIAPVVAPQTLTWCRVPAAFSQRSSIWPTTNCIKTGQNTNIWQFRTIYPSSLVRFSSWECKSKLQVYCE